MPVSIVRASVFTRSALAIAIAGAGTLACASIAQGAPPAYSPAGSYGLGFGAWDVRADGRIVRIDQSDVYVQDALNLVPQTKIGSIATGLIDPFGASFLRLSPDGSRFALGDNGFTAAAKTYIVNTADLNLINPTTPAGIVAPNYAAAWESSSRLYVAGGLFGSPAQVARIDLEPALTATQVIADAGGASGGVAPYAGRLYAGVGFSGFGSSAGDIRSFALSALNAAPGATPFLGGLFVVSALSAASLDFDALGNLIVGGFGSIAVIDPATLERIDLTPASPNDFYSARFNAATSEILVQAFGSPIVYRYQVPAPPAALAPALAALLLAARRRR